MKILLEFSVYIRALDPQCGLCQVQTVNSAASPLKSTLHKNALVLNRLPQIIDSYISQTLCVFTSKCILCVLSTQLLSALNPVQHYQTILDYC